MNEYEQLAKIYYKNPNSYDEEYKKRMNDYAARKLPFQIKPFKSNIDFDAFYVQYHGLEMKYEKIIRQSKFIQSLLSQLPGIAPERYILGKLVDEMLSTNEIEGVRSTRAEMTYGIEFITHPEIKKTKKIRHKSLINSYLKLTSSDIHKIGNIADIRNIYDELVQDEIKEDDQLDGELFRKDPVDVTTRTDRVIHRGVYPEKLIQNHLEKLLSFLNQSPFPMLYKIAIAHYYFGYIHPFYDGNGRTSRFISSVYLFKTLDPLTAITLSFSTNKYRSIYYQAFEDANNPLNKGELTMFCEAFFEILDRAQDDILEDMSERKKEMDQLDEIMIQEADLIENDDDKDILYFLGQNSIFGTAETGLFMKDIENISGLSPYKISNSIKRLDTLGYIEYLKKRPIEITLSQKIIRKLTKKGILESTE